jgi:hypothetical protein
MSLPALEMVENTFICPKKSMKINFPRSEIVESTLIRLEILEK